MNLLDILGRRQPKPDPLREQRAEHQEAMRHAETVLATFAEADGIVVSDDARILQSPRFRRRAR